MKTATIAAAAAGLIGTTLADDGWDNWSSTAKDPVTTSTEWQSWTSSTAKDPITTAAETWSEWSTTSSAKDPEKTSSWSEWTTTSSKKDPETTATWSDWSSTIEDPKTTATWSEWSTSSTEKDPKTTAWSEWSSTADDPKTTAWSEWSSESDPQTTSWGAWNEPVTTTVLSSTKYVTVTVYPVSTSSAAQTWSDWSSADPTTSSWSDWSASTVNAVTSTASATWSAWTSATTADADSNTWSAWDPTAPQCAIQVSLSYGAPTWVPTPVVQPASSASSTWADWTSTSTVAAATPSTWASWSADPTTSTWADWSSTSTVAAATPSTWASWSADPTTSSWAAWSSSQGSATATSSSWSSWSTGSGQLSSNGNKLGMTYSPYTASGGCKDAGTVSSDIAQIAKLGFTSVRVYSTDCNTLENVGSAAKASGIKIILGVFISSTGISGAKPQVDAIVSWAQWDLVELTVVGNEAIFNNYCSASELAGFITTTKAALKAAGYNGLVTTTEELSVWQEHGSELCDAVDITGANLYAFFNAETTADQAGTFIQSEIAELEGICKGKDVYAMECGWPSAGECNGAACPSPENQKTALTSIQQLTGAKIVFFSFEDEQWKQPGQFGVEQHWGCKDVF